MFSKLGRFEIKDVIGRGAMGEVYLGVDPLLGREVAIKTIISSALPEDQARQRFDREAKAAAVLNSPNIVTIHELGEDQGVLFIAMERLKGQDLEQILLQRSLTLVESLEVLAQVCDGLDAAHRNHIIHRDIKPSNIMVMREGRKLLVKLMDFGVARLKDSAMTMIGTVVGTVNYIAPEYIRSGEPDARSDLFAVGVMLYECIAGRKPFEGGSASTVLFKIVNDPPDPLDLTMLHGLNPALRNMTEKALAKDPDDRFQSAEEFALALRAAKDPAWNGSVEETTLRMRIRPELSAPTFAPSSGQTVAMVVPAMLRSEPATGTAKTAANPTQCLAAEAKAITQELVLLPAVPAAKTELLAQPEAASAKVITQEVAIRPSPVPLGAAQAAKTEVIACSEASERVVPRPLGIPAEPFGTPLLPVAKPLPEVPAASKPFYQPQTAKTVVLQLPQTPIPPATQVPAPAEALAPTVGTPMAVATSESIAESQLEPASAEVITEEPAIRPSPASMGEVRLDRTEVLPLPKAFEPAVPRPAAVTPKKVWTLTPPPPAKLTPEVPVVSKPFSEPQAAKTVVLKLPQLPVKPFTPAPATPEALVSALGTPMVAATPASPAIPPMAMPVAKTAVIAVPAAPEPPNVSAPEVMKPIPAAEQTQVSLGSGEPSGASKTVESSPASSPLPDTLVATNPPQSVEVASADAGGATTSETLSSLGEPSNPAPDRPPRSSKGLLIKILGLVALAVVGGLGYLVFKSRVVPPPSVAPLSPTLSNPTPLPPSLPVPQAQAPSPIPEANPAATQSKPPTPKGKGKTPLKAPPALAKVPEPAPVIVNEVVVPLPAAPAAAPPPPVLDEKAKRKLWAAESTKKRLERQDNSKK